MEEETRATNTPKVNPNRNWTEGSILRNLLTLAWPMVLSNTLNIIGPTVDMIWVGKLGADAVAGVGAGGIAVMLLAAAMMGLFTGLRAMIARFVGAGDNEGASRIIRQALIVSIAFSAIMVPIGIFFAEEILSLMGLEPAVVAEGAAYMRIMFVSTIIISLRLVSESTMQSSGDTLTPLKIIALVRLVQVALCPLFIFGWGIFPEMGVSGAAIANVGSQILGLSLGLWVLLSGKSRLKLILRNFRPDLGIIWRMAKIGVPASIMTIQSNLGNLALMWLMAPYGTLAVAAHAICQRIDMMLFMPGIGLGVATGVLVGQNLGARRPERAVKSGWLAVSIAEAFTILSAGAILIWAESVIGIFSTDPVLIELASRFLRIAAFSYLVLGFIVVFTQSIAGAGDTLPPMLISIAIIWAIQVPMAFFLSRVVGLGAEGVRWAVVVAMTFGAITYTLYFRTGRWRRKRI